jgi:NDP-sugar pyrophosphorylase family protein
VSAVPLEQIVAVILAGGLGKRIQHLLPDLPKPMAPLAGRPCVEWLVRYLVHQGIRRVVISTGYLAEAFERHFSAHPVPGVAVRCLAEPEPLGTAGGLAYAIQASGEKSPAWLVLNGDTFAFAELAQAAAVLAEPGISGVIFGRPVPDTSRYGSLVLDSCGNLVRFEEKRSGQGLISTGIYLFRERLLEQFPAKTPLSLEREVFPALTQRGALLRVLLMDAPFLDIGTPESLVQADSFVQANRARFALDPL